MKKLIAFMITTLLIFNFNIYSFAAPDKPVEQSIKVKLNDELLKFDVNPVIVNDRTMVPMRAIFEHLDSRVLWYPDTRTVVGYKDNMFIKLNIGKETAYKNGKSFTLDSPPIIKNSRTLVPVRFIAESFGMLVGWDANTRTVNLSYDKTISSGKIIENMLYKPVDVKDYGLKFMIPDYWEVVDNSNHSFIYEEDDNKVQMNIDIAGFEEPKTLEEFTQENKGKILSTYKEKVVFTGNSKLTVNNVDISVAYLKNSAVDPELNQAIYYVVTPTRGYIISFSYYSDANDSQYLNTFSNIIKTLQITNLTVNYSDEHYIEYDKFFELGVKVDSQIYSNMDVKNSFDFKGSVNKDAKIDYLFVQVSKENEKLEERVPIKDSSFNTTIYTPFGLGKHNVIVGTPIDEENISQYIMQFSVINTSSENIRNLIPSRYIEKDDPEIVALAKEITEDYYLDRDKTRAIYKWITDNITYDVNASTDEPRSAKQVLTAKKGDCDEISYLYTALSRSIDIPSKIGSGKIGNELHTWNEFLVNGKWIIADATWGSGYIQEDGTAFIKEVNMKYFDINRTDYEKQFTNIEYLPY